MNEKKNLNEYYQGYDEDGRLLSRHGMVEYTTTMRYIERYLKPGARIMEIGAGTGRYSHALARMGYRVDAVELVEHNIEIFRQNTAAEEDITVTQGSAVDMSAFESDRYDITLLLGPMYHLSEREERQQALSEAIRVTKRGGVIFAAYCMGDAVLLSHGFRKSMIKDIVKQCCINTDNFDGFHGAWDLFSLYCREDIDCLRSNFAVTQLHFVAADGYANHMRAELAEMDKETYELYLRYHLSACERHDMTGISHHTLDIFRKD